MWKTHIMKMSWLLHQRLVSLGAEPMPGTPDQFDTLLAAQLAVAANLARKAGIKAA